MNSFDQVLPIVAASTLTPVVMAVLRRFSPGRYVSHYDMELLGRRNAWLSVTANLMSFAGVVLPFVLFGRGFNNVGWPALGLVFGGAAVLPVLWVCLLTVPFGNSRFSEFWNYYQAKYKIGLSGVLVLYIPCALFGLASVQKLIQRGVW